MDKKKKITKTQEEEQTVPETGTKEESRTMVTQVVEVVETDKQAPSNDQTEEVDSHQNTPPPSESESPKQVVEELFSKRDIASPITTQKRSSFFSMLLWAVIVVVVAMATGGGLIFLSKQFTSGSTQIVSTPTPTVAPTPTPAVVVTREELSVQVLNGGGVAGAAGKMKTLLVEKGYNVTNVSNTDEYAYETTEIEVKLSKSGALELLKEDLSGEYSLGTTGATLSEDSPYDAKVIVGKK